MDSLEIFCVAPAVFPAGAALGFVAAFVLEEAGFAAFLDEPLDLDF
jgi:hypothetical protein